MNKRRIIILAVANIPVFLIIGKVYFGSLAGFLDCLRYWGTSDMVSRMEGEYWDHVRSSWDLFFFVGGCAALLAGEYYLVGKFFG